MQNYFKKQRSVRRERERSANRSHFSTFSPQESANFILCNLHQSDNNKTHGINRKETIDYQVYLDKVS